MKIQLVLTIIGCALECLIYAGSLYGWPSLQPILVKEGFFSNSCSTNHTTEVVCPYQIEQLGLVFTIATSVSPILAIGVGYCLDHYGNWNTRTVMLLVFLTGLLLTATATLANSWILFISLSLCNFAGYGLLYADLAIGNLLPYYRASIVTFMSGAFDSGTMAFLGFRKLYELGVSYQTIFYVYSGGVVFFIIHTFLLTPKRTAPFVLPDDYVYGYKELKCYVQRKKRNLDEEDAAKELNVIKSDDKENPDNQTLKDCFRQIYTWTELIHYCVLHFAVNFFIESFNSWIATKVEPASIDKYTTAFGATQSLGILLAPFGGILIDFCRRKFTKTIGFRLGSLKSVTVLLLINDLLVIAMMVLSLVPNAEIQYLTMAFQVLSRAFVYATAAAFANAVYPTHFFGFMYGLTEAAGGFALLLQYPVTLLLTRVLDNDFQIVNAVMLGICLLNLMHPIYLFIFIRNEASKRNHELEMENITELKP